MPHLCLLLLLPRRETPLALAARRGCPSLVEALLQQALLLVKQVGVAMQLRGLLALQLGVVQYKHRQAGHGKLLLAPCHRLETALPAWMLHAWVQGGWKRP